MIKHSLKATALILSALASLISVSCANEKEKSEEPGYIIQVSIGDWHQCHYNPDEVIERIEEVSGIIPVEKVMVGWCLDREPYEKIGRYLRNKGIQFILYLPIYSETEDMINARAAVDLWGNLPPEELLSKVSGFRFNCPSDPVTLESITRIFESNFKDLHFDGVFLDRIRTQSFVGGVSGIFECACVQCLAEYEKLGVDLNEVKAEYERLGDDFFSVEGYSVAEGFKFTNPMADSYFKAKGKVVSSEVCRVADYFHSRGLIVGFDLFAPIVSQFVGQDYSLLASHADFIKPMLYRITDAPAGIGYEYDLIRKSVPLAKGYEPLVMDLEFLKGQLEAMKDLPCRIYPGIEINRSDGIVNSTPEYLQESIGLLLDYGCDGAVLSWNIMQAPDENIRALTIFSDAARQEESLNMLVGTYTDASGSHGVYLYSFNQENGEAVLLDSASAANPSFVIPSADRRFAYSVSENEDGSQGVYSYKLGTGSIETLNRVSGAGGSPCNIAIAGNNIVTSDYGGGTLSVFPLNEDGTVGEKSFSFAPSHNNPRTVSRIHCAAPSPDGRYLFITDLGADAIYRADISGKMPGNFVTTCIFDPGLHPGPRHLTFSSDGRFAYLISEKGDCVSSFSYDNGNLTLLESQLAYDGEGHGSADIHLSPDNCFLYTSHRLKADGIAVFKRDADTGKLQKAGYCPTGKHPRNFAITPDGSLLLCACRDDNRIEIYSIDPKTGELSNTGKNIPVKAPVCIQIYSTGSY